jgi:hypothetical protein
MTTPFLYEPTWERMDRAVQRVTERLNRAVAALEAGGMPYAVVGGHAVANWVARVDPEAVRNTRDVDIVVRRADFDRVKQALEAAGFVYANLLDVDMFLDGPDGKPSGAVHLLYAGEKVRPEYDTHVADLSESEPSTSFRVVSLEALVRMKLQSNRRKDQTHVIDLIHVGLVDHTWPDRFPQLLADRLRELLNDPKEH